MSTGTIRFSKGDKVVVPGGLTGTVRALETEKTGQPGRPKTVITVKTKNGLETFYPSSLSAV